MTFVEAVGKFDSNCSLEIPVETGKFVIQWVRSYLETSWFEVYFEFNEGVIVDCGCMLDEEKANEYFLSDKWECQHINENIEPQYKLIICDDVFKFLCEANIPVIFHSKGSLLDLIERKYKIKNTIKW